MEIQEIKARLSIEQVLRHYGITINRNGHIKCPFHDDKQASMRVYRDTNTVYCFAGSCPTTGHSLDAIDFIMNREKCSKHEALKKAAELCGELPALPKKEEKARKVAANLTLEEVFNYMRNGLLRTASAQKYLAGRGLDYLNLEIGYSSGQMHYHKESQYLSDLEAIGIIKPLERGGYLTFAKNGVVFPLKDSAGRVCSLYGRSIEGKNHYYLSGRSGLYPGYPPSGTKRVILTESVIDAASLLQIKDLSDYFILALYGTNGLTAEHKNALQSLPQLEELIIMLDGDEAGRKAASSIAIELQQFFLSIENKNCVVRKVDLPENSDINELWANHGSAEQFLELLAQSSQNEPSRTEMPIATVIEPEPEAKSKLQITNPTYLVWTTEGLRIEVLGGLDMTVTDSLRATLRLSREPKRTALDTVRQSLDLYHNGQLSGLLRKLHEQLDLPLHLLRLELAELTDALENYRAVERQKMGGKSIKKRVLSKEQEAAARAYLMDKNLMERTFEDLGKVGLVGERENALVMFLCFCSRKLSNPLHIISLGSSGSGKTHLQELISSLMPEEEVVTVTSLSDNALYYYGDGALEHKLFLVEDMDGLSEDAQYALRELKSKGSVAREVPLKDSRGRLQTVRVSVMGPICFAGCTTKERVYEDNANRCLLLYRDETEGHRAAVMAAQRRAAAGLVDEWALAQLREQFKDCQMLLKAVKVVNPYAEQLVLPDKVFKPLRTNAHYLKFIEVITFYHQLQRPIKKNAQGENYIETSLEDIEWANKLLKDILLAKSDELNWQLRQFLENLKNWLQSNGKGSFGSMELRRAFRMAPSTQIKYLSELQRYGLLKVLGGSRYKGYEYALTNYDDYEALENEIESAFDKVFSTIKTKLE